MPQVLRCPNCARALQVPDRLAGKRIRCPACKKEVAVPAPAAVVAARGESMPAGDPSPHPATAPPPPGPVSACPACKAELLPGAVACLDCGYLLHSELEADADSRPNLCPNGACGVANAPGDKVCQRCGSPLPTPPGTLLHGRYRIERQLAVGGFGAVYLATDNHVDNRPVAIKDMICADPQEFGIRLNFFRREAEILRSLEEVPVVPRVFDFIEQGQSAHLVLEYIRGRDLMKILESNGNKPFPIELVVEWGQGICDVLTHMHGQSPPLVHRDLKPDNIMLLEDQRHIKMIDFGTARDMGRTRQSRLAAKTRVYTEGYAPLPEQIIGKPEPRSDLFALAGTLYHLATGKSPEGSYTVHDLDVRLADPDAVADHWFWELLKINLSEEQNERYFSAREFKADLEKRQVTREVSCPKCQTANKVRAPYCSRCAETLTDPAPPCNHCGKAGRLGSRCCIHCGNRLR